MLRADRAHLEARMAQLAVEVRAREARLFDQNFQLLSKLSAFTMGIGFMILFMKLQYVEKVMPSYGFRDFDSPGEVLYVFFTCLSVSATKKACNSSIMAISASIGLLFGQCDAHCLSSWHDDRHQC